MEVGKTNKNKCCHIESQGDRDKVSRFVLHSYSAPTNQSIERILEKRFSEQ
jgi:hypothetical protein